MQLNKYIAFKQGRNHERQIHPQRLGLPALKATKLLTNLKAETGSFSSFLTFSPTWIKPNYQIWYVQNMPQQNKEVYSTVSTLL